MVCLCSCCGYMNGSHRPNEGQRGRALRRTTVSWNIKVIAPFLWIASREGPPPLVRPGAPYSPVQGIMSVPGRFRLLITMLIAEKSGMPLIKRDVRFGSKADLRTTTTERPLCAISGRETLSGSEQSEHSFACVAVRNA